MNKVSLLTKVGDRIAIPVRALPFLSGWFLHSHEVALGMARIPDSGYIPEFANLFAYRISETGPIRVKAEEWRDISHQFTELAQELPLDHRKTFGAWSDDGLRLLPPATFFWLDEFMEEFNRHITTLPGDSTLPQATFAEDNVSKHDLKLILEGFESIQSWDAVSGDTNYGQHILEQRQPAVIHTHKSTSRSNILDPAIKRAIELAGNSNTADVFLKLRELALEGTPPFSGLLDKGALWYSDASSKQKSLSKDALHKRLKRRPD